MAKERSDKNWFAQHKILTVIIALVVLGLLGSAFGENKSPSQDNNSANKTEQKAPTSTAKQEEKPKEPAVPVEYKSALKQADTYANSMHLSKKGLYDQLVSEYGGKFTPEAAQYATDNVKADWNANALSQAKTYQNDMHLSPAAVRDQLVSEHGGKFTEAEADYAIANLNK